MPIARGCSDEKKRKGEKKPCACIQSAKLAQVKKKNPGHGLWETILAIIYDFPGCVGAMPSTRGEGKRREEL